MADDSKRRQAQLEEKRQRLEQLRRRRQIKDKERETSPLPPPPTAGTEGGEERKVGGAEQQASFDAYIEGLLGEPEPQSEATDGRDGSDEQGQAGGAPEAPRAAKPAKKLTRSTGLAQVEVLPRPVEVYDKECQVELEQLVPVPEPEFPIGTKTPQKATKQRRSRGGPPTPKGGEAAKVEATQTDGTKSEPKRVLDAEEKKDITSSDQFQQFLLRSSLVVERTLGANSAYDALVDYGGDDGPNRSEGGEKIHKCCQPYSERWCTDRAVTDMHWSPHHSELVLCSYSARGASVQQAASAGAGSASDLDGVVLVWSLAMENRPEYVLQSHSPVLCARFHGSDPHLVIGGTYLGQVLMWDARVKSMPVQRTPLSSLGHTHPVYNMSIQGSGTTQALVTASMDGKVAWWNLSQLAQPTEDLQLEHTGVGGASTPLTISSFALEAGDGQKDIAVGTESGSIYTSSVRGRNAGLTEYKGHFGMVTSVDFNHGRSKAAQGLFLSSSVDWTTRLWRAKHTAGPLLTFPSGNCAYVCDARWSPRHPALFATANTLGELAVWNLNNSTEEPLMAPVEVVNGCALTKLGWAPGGRRLSAGDANGSCHIYALAEEIAMPRQDEEVLLEESLATAGASTREQ
ncbi:unnamed protein product [Chrysoparadoxa australica]